MKLAVSSIAWEPAHDAAVRAMLAHRGVRGIELTPLKYWPAGVDVAPHVLADYKAQWSDAGISIVALQGILFGMPELQLFGSPSQQAALEAHLAAIARLASALGAGILVFGAAKNRLRGALTEDEAIAAAVPLLRRVASVCTDVGITLCIEPNPPRYGGDFVHTSADAMRLVREVDHFSFGLHLDAGAFAINAESDSEVIEAARHARHFHISEIDLVPTGSGTVDHRRLGRLLRLAAFERWHSIEMTPVAAEPVVEALGQAVNVALESYP